MSAEKVLTELKLRHTKAPSFDNVCLMLEWSAINISYFIRSNNGPQLWTVLGWHLSANHDVLHILLTLLGKMFCLARRFCLIMGMSVTQFHDALERDDCVPGCASRHMHIDASTGWVDAHTNSHTYTQPHTHTHYHTHTHTNTYTHS